MPSLYQKKIDLDNLFQCDIMHYLKYQTLWVLFLIALCAHEIIIFYLYFEGKNISDSADKLNVNIYK